MTYESLLEELHGHRTSDPRFIARAILSLTEADAEYLSMLLTNYEYGVSDVGSAVKEIAEEKIRALTEAELRGLGVAP